MVGAAVGLGRKTRKRVPERGGGGEGGESEGVGASDVVGESGEEGGGDGGDGHDAGGQAHDRTEYFVPKYSARIVTMTGTPAPQASPLPMAKATRIAIAVPYARASSDAAWRSMQPMMTAREPMRFASQPPRGRPAKFAAVMTVVRVAAAPSE